MSSTTHSLHTPLFNHLISVVTAGQKRSGGVLQVVSGRLWLVQGLDSARMPVESVATPYRCPKPALNRQAAQRGAPAPV